MDTKMIMSLYLLAEYLAWLMKTICHAPKLAVPIPSHWLSEVTDIGQPMQDNADQFRELTIRRTMVQYIRHR